MKILQNLLFISFKWANAKNYKFLMKMVEDNGFNKNF